MDDLISRQAAIEALGGNEPVGDPSKMDDDDVVKMWERIRIINIIIKLPSAQPEPCGDVVSRNAIIQKLNTMDRYVSEELRLCDTDKKFPKNEVFIVDDVYEEIVEQLPSAQPERTCVNCGRTANNGGWYADGRTRCPIEEHYALPKDGFCYLWEKRNVTDDDYPERRTDEE